MRSNSKCIGFMLSFVCAWMNIHAQHQTTISSIEEFIGDVFEQYTAETEQELDAGLFYEELMTLYAHPINLNNTSKEALEKMMFLSDSKIENIMYYLYRFGPMRSIYELQLIEGLDMTDIRYMLPFVSIGEVKGQPVPIHLSQVIKYGKNEVLGSFAQVLENKSGYMSQKDDSSKYMGNSLYHHLKYRFHYKDRILINITGEKDAGEQFLKEKGSGYDFYSASIQVKDIGWIHNLVVGDYQAGFGQGLVVKKSFMRGKSSMTTQVSSNTNGFKRYSSTNEYNYFRGTAMSLHYQKVHMHFFYSNKSIDGNVQDDTFPGFYITGYHRTQQELQKKNTVKQMLYGGNITFTGSTYQVGITSVYLHMDKHLFAKTYPYNLFYFKGNQQLVTGINYRMRCKKLHLFGETAITNKAPATINGCTYTPLQRVSIVLVHRYYAPAYNSLLAAAFSEGSSTTNELGVYLGVEMTPFKYWKFAAYADSYRFPWLKYGIDTPGGGKDFLLQANYSSSQRTNMFWRMKYEQNIKNKVANGTVAQLENYYKSSLRYQLVHAAGNFKLKNIVEGNIVQKAANSLTYGIAAMQEVSYTCQTIPLVVDIRYLFFDAVNYDNRIYSYEKDVLYAFPFTMFSGMGSRYYINLRYDLSKSLSCWLKLSQVSYADDRVNMGSGHELIMGNKKTEIKCLVRWKFNNNW